MKNRSNFIFSKMRFHTSLAIIVFLIGIVLVLTGAFLAAKNKTTDLQESKTPAETAEQDSKAGTEQGDSSFIPEILFSVGASLIAAGIISFLDIWKDAKYDEMDHKDQLMQASGMEYAHEARDLAEYPDLIKKSKYSIDVLGYSLRAFYQRHADELYKKLSVNPNYKIRILVADPSYVISKDKEAEENNGVVNKVFATNYHNIIHAFGMFKENVEIRLTKGIISTMIFRVDDRMFIGPYFYKTDSKNTLTYEISEKGWLFKEHQKEFDNLWRDSQKPEFVFLYHYYTERIKDANRNEFPPLGMLYLCAMLEEHGYPVKVVYFDENTHPEELPYAYVYAYSISSSANYKYFRNIVPKLKNKAILHIAGNTHVNVFPQETLHELGLDAVFVGESEKTLMDWVEGGMIRTGVITGSRQENIDFPFPARHLIPDDKIYMQNRVGGEKNNSISLITSRGCKHNCLFCAIQNRGSIYYRTVSDIEEELDCILKRYPKCDGFTVLDEGFTQNKEHAASVSKLFKDRGLSFECNSRIDTLKDGIIPVLAQNNCAEVRIGLESGSQALLTSMRKGIDLESAYNTFKELSEAGLRVKVYLMHGYPGENKETTKATISYLERIRPYINRISLYKFAPLPGSPIYKSKVIINKPDWDEYTIYENNMHWWGTDAEFKEMQEAYLELERYVKAFK